MAEDHKEQLTQATMQKTEEREANVMAQVGQAMNTVATELAKLVSITTQSLQVQEQSRDLLVNPPPRKVSIGAVQTDANGVVTGANISTAPQTIQ